MKISKEKYLKMTQEMSPNSPKVKDTINAFLFGGLICAVAQIFLELYLYLGMSVKTSSTLVSCTMIVISAVLTSIGVYDKIARYAGAGTLVPITGFANSIISQAMEFQSEGRILGTGANMFKIAGPVLVYGTTAAVIYGIIFYILTLIK